MSSGFAIRGWQLEIDGIQGGVLAGRLRRSDDPAGDVPVLELVSDGLVVAEIEQAPIVGAVAKFTVDVPNSVLKSGASVLLICDQSTGLPLGTFPMRLGFADGANDPDEIELLRAELAQLKQAFLSDASDPKLRVVERDLIIAEALEAAISVISKVDQKL